MIKLYMRKCIYLLIRAVISGRIEDKKRWLKRSDWKKKEIENEMEGNDAVMRLGKVASCEWLPCRKGFSARAGGIL